MCWTNGFGQTQPPHLDMTENLERYDTVKASRPIKDFAGDFSTWYVRRSRERVRKLNLDIECPLGHSMSKFKQN